MRKAALALMILPTLLFPASTFAENVPKSVLVTKVVDGDTLKLSDGHTVRLIGVDTPETVHPTKPVQYFGKEASAFTKRMAQDQTVTLEYDQQRIDKYGRTLAYVYLDDGRMLNAEIIKQGYGFAYTRFPFKYMEEFREYERQARETGVGLWANNGPSSMQKAASPLPKKEAEKV